MTPQVSDPHHALKQHLVREAEVELENIWGDVAANPNKPYMLTDQGERHVYAGVCARTAIYSVWHILEPLLLTSETLQEAVQRAIDLDSVTAEPNPAAAAERALWAWLQTRFLQSMLGPHGVIQIRGRLTDSEVAELRRKFETGGFKTDIHQVDIRPGDDHVPPGNFVCDRRPFWQRWLRRNDA